MTTDQMHAALDDLVTGGIIGGWTPPRLNYGLGAPMSPYTIMPKDEGPATNYYRRDDLQRYLTMADLLGEDRDA